MSETFREAHRSYTGLLAAAEKRLLIRIARRMPNAINSDHLTALALASMFMVGASYALSSRYVGLLWCVVGALALNWFGDSLDGTLARVRGHQRPRYGFYVDHVFDSFGALFLVGGLALSGRMTPMIAAAVLLAYFLLSIETFLATYSVGRFQMSHWGAGPTELRMLLAVGTLVLFVKPTVTIAGRSIPLFDAGGIVATIILTITAIISTVRHTRELYLAEPLVTRAPGQALDHLADDVLCVPE
jgi:archaetidylinositol phosphate synthase